MINIPMTTTILKMVALFLSFLTMVLTAAFIQMYKSYDTGMWLTGWRSVWSGGITPQFASATIAAMVFNILYFTYYLVFLFWRPASIFICMIVDTSILGFLFLFNIGAIGSFSANAAFFSNCNTAGGHCHVGRAAVAFGWFTLLTILGLLAFQVTWTLLHYGMSMSTWKTPFNELLLYGATGSGLRKTVGSSSNASAVAEEGKFEPVGQQQQQQQQYSAPGFVQHDHQQPFTPTSSYAPVATNVNQGGERY